MATNWVCPIDGCLPADNGSNTATLFSNGANSVATIRAEDAEWVASAGAQVALNGAAALGDYNGLAPHCPVCGAATIAANAAFVTTRTGVASGSQHPADVNAAYVTATDAPLAQSGATPYAITAGQAVQPHVFTKGQGSTGTVPRGTATVTAETINATQGP